MDKFIEQIFSQLLALMAFFSFPAMQYFLLKKISKKEGTPELWYLPKYGFRLVIRNKPRKKTLRDIKYIVSIRWTVPPSEGCSISTGDAKDIITGEKLFLFRGYDQILLSFRLERNDDGNLIFIQTDKFGYEKEQFPLNTFDYLRCDYFATIQNYFNFNIQIGKRVKINSSTLSDIYKDIQQNSMEKQFKCDRIWNIG